VKPNVGQRSHARTSLVEAYLRHQASLRAPDDLADTPGYAKVVHASREAERYRPLSSDKEYAKWWSAYDCGAVVEVDDFDGRAKRAGAENDGAASDSWVYDSYWSKGGADDDDGDGGDEADSGPCRF
jgi:hypothetical protein